MPGRQHPPFLGAWSDRGADEREPREPLSRRRIVAAAIALLDERGVEGLSMRTLADELQTRATSLYRHVRDKGELLDLTMDALMAEVALPTGDVGWQEMLRETALSLRAMLRRHPGAAIVRGTRMAFGPNTLGLIEAVCSRLVAAGFSDQEAAATAATIINYTIGSVLAEAMPIAHLAAAGYSREEFEAEMAEQLTALPVEQYPVTRRILPDLIGYHHDWPFEFGLDALLHGLAAGRERSSAGAQGA